MSEPRPYQCLNCFYLTSCIEATEERVAQQYVCPKWEAADPGIVMARNRIIRDFGPEGLRATKNTEGT